MSNFYIQLAFYLFFTFAFVPGGAYFFVALVLKPQQKEIPILLALSPMVGLSLFSMILFYLLFFIPGQNDYFYSIASLVPFVIPYALLLKFPHLGKGIIQGFGDVFKGISRFEFILTLGAIILCLSLIYLTLITPLFANDPLLYFEMSRYIYDSRSFRIYPMIEAYSTGYFQPSWHPPGYHALLVWSFIWQQSTQLSIFGKLIAAFSTIFTAILLFVMVKIRATSFTGIAAAIILLGTPLAYSHTAISHIDPIRMATFLGAVAAALLFLQRQDVRSAILLGLMIGFSMRAHASGILAIPIIGGAVLLLMEGGFKHRVALLSLTALSVIMISGFDWIRNFTLLGGVIPGTEELYKVYTIPNLDFDFYTKAKRGILGGSEILFNGILKGFFDINSFSLTYWLMLVGILVLLFKKRFTLLSRLFALQLAFYFFLVATTVAFGIDTLIKNIRYPLIMQPFVAYFGAVAMEAFYGQSNRS